MNEHRAIVAQLDSETRACLERVAGRRGVTPESFAAEAIRRVTESEDDFDAFLQVGIDQAERGELIPHEEVMAELDAMVDRARARCR